MASLAFPLFAQKATLTDGVTYGYVAIAPAQSGKPTFLFLHGYPSSSYDWRHQITDLSAAGYGVVAPDLLGYGDTDKPADLEAYRMKSMSHHMREILDLESVTRCIVVSHDWGAGLASRLATYIPERLYGMVMLSVGYVEPGMVWDIDAFNKLTEQLFGYATYGYWPWHNTEQAVKDCDDHPASVFTLIYAADAKDWKTNLAPIDAASSYVRENRIDALPPWYSLHEYTMRDRIMAASGYQGPMSWYKAAMRGMNDADEAGLLDAARSCSVPVMLVVSDEDYVTRADMQIAKSKEWVPDLRVETFDCGHWIQLERPAALLRVLESFAVEATATELSGVMSDSGSWPRGVEGEQVGRAVVVGM